MSPLDKLPPRGTAQLKAIIARHEALDEQARRIHLERQRINRECVALKLSPRAVRALVRMKNGNWRISEAAALKTRHLAEIYKKALDDADKT